MILDISGESLRKSLCMNYFSTQYRLRRLKICILIFFFFFRYECICGPSGAGVDGQGGARRHFRVPRHLQPTGARRELAELGPVPAVRVQVRRHQGQQARHSLRR